MAAGRVTYYYHASWDLYKEILRSRRIRNSYAEVQTAILEPRVRLETAAPLTTDAQVTYTNWNDAEREGQMNNVTVIIEVRVEQQYVTRDRNGDWVHDGEISVDAFQNTYISDERGNVRMFRITNPYN